MYSDLSEFVSPLAKLAVGTAVLTPPKAKIQSNPLSAPLLRFDRAVALICDSEKDGSYDPLLITSSALKAAVRQLFKPTGGNRVDREVKKR